MTSDELLSWPLVSPFDKSEWSVFLFCFVKTKIVYGLSELMICWILQCVSLSSWDAVRVFEMLTVFPCEYQIIPTSLFNRFFFFFNNDLKFFLVCVLHPWIWVCDSGSWLWFYLVSLPQVNEFIFAKELHVEEGIPGAQWSLYQRH